MRLLNLSYDTYEGILLEQWFNLLRETCQLIRELCVHNDDRREMSCAYDNGRMFVSANVVPVLISLASKFETEPNVAAAAISAVRQLITSEEAVQVVAANGGLDLPLAVLGSAKPPVTLVRSVAGLLRNLCADDARKAKLIADGSLSLLVRILESPDYNSDHKCVEHILACIAAMALRSPRNANRIVEVGAVEGIVRGMRIHPQRELLQRQGCLAIRNIAARSPDLRSRLVDLGVEIVLRHAGTLRGAVDEAYSALRDVGVEVQYVRVVEGGGVEPVFQTFGNPSQKPQFNPVYDESTSIAERVEQKARAPFTPSGLDNMNGEERNEENLSPHDHNHDHTCCDANS